jgi:hypothetical protein
LAVGRRWQSAVGCWAFGVGHLTEPTQSEEAPITTIHAPCPCACATCAMHADAITNNAKKQKAITQNKSSAALPPCYWHSL